MRNSLGPKIKAYALGKKISQVELSKRVGISRIALNRFFCGKSEILAQDLMNMFKELGVETITEFHNE